MSDPLNTFTRVYKPLNRLSYHIQGQAVVEDGRRTIVHEEKGCYGLEITNLTMADTGEYECVAENEAGEARCSVSIDVEGIKAI